MSPRGFWGLSGIAALVAPGLVSCATATGSGSGGGDLSTSEVVALPDTARRTFVDFGGKVHLVGVALSPESGGPGDSLRLDLYWKAASRLPAGWSLFTHLEDDSGHQLW